MSFVSLHNTLENYDNVIDTEQILVKLSIDHLFNDAILRNHWLGRKLI